jgi:hypothetical protein
MIKRVSSIVLIIATGILITSAECYSSVAKESEAAAVEEMPEGAVKFTDGLISVQAKDMRPEDLIKELGEKCAIKIVLYGEVFTDAPLSVQFQQMPVRESIQRLLRLSKIKNYLMHFGENEKDRDRIVQIDLIGKKGGQRELTTGMNKNIKQLVAEQMKGMEGMPNPRRAQPEQPKIAGPMMSKEEAEKLQQNFLNMMDMMLEQKFEKGEEPDPSALLQLFNDMVPPDMRDKLPPEILEQLEKLKE